MNTAIASMMEFLNDWEASLNVNRLGNPYGETSNVKRQDDTGSVNEKRQTLSKEHAKQFLQILAPLAPFLTEEIWRTVFGEKTSIHLSSWPKVEGEIVEEEAIIPVQVNGKLRSTLKVQKSKIKNQKEIEKLALNDEKVKKYLEGKQYRVIYVQGKIINFIVK